MNYHVYVEGDIEDDETNYLLVSDEQWHSDTDGMLVCREYVYIDDMYWKRGDACPACTSYIKTLTPASEDMAERIINIERSL